MYRRSQYNELKSRIEEPRDKIQVLSGPRQVGKSTLVKQVLQEIDLPYMDYFSYFCSGNIQNYGKIIRYGRL